MASSEGAAAAYEVRSLRADEREAWLDHLEECFAAKGTPRSYFATHLEEDPWLNWSNILVAVERASGHIAATVRVFTRRMVAAPQAAAVLVGGIGEVSTRPAHRGHGLASRLLAEAAALMAAQGMAASLLHASPIYAGLYARGGWTALPMPWWRQPLPAAAALRSSSSSTTAAAAAKWRARQLPPGEAPGAACRELHARQHQRFAGAFVRDHPDYWDGWVAAGLRDASKGLECWVLEQGGEEHSDGERHSDASLPATVAYAVLRVHPRQPDTLKVTEFFSCSDSVDDEEGEVAVASGGKAAALCALLAAALEARAGKDLCSLEYPLALVPTSAVPQSADGEAFSDAGWMFRVHGPGAEGLAATLADPCSAAGQAWLAKHVIFALDAL